MEHAAPNHDPHDTLPGWGPPDRDGWRLAFPLERPTAEHVRRACVRHLLAEGRYPNVRKAVREIERRIGREMPRAEISALVDEAIASEFFRFEPGKPILFDAKVVPKDAPPAFDLASRAVKAVPVVSLREAVDFVDMTYRMASCFSTRVRPVEDGVEISVTCFDPDVATDMDGWKPVAGSPAFPLEIYRIDGSGRMTGSREWHRTHRLETVAWSTARERPSQGDHFSSRHVDAFVEWSVTHVRSVKRFAKAFATTEGSRRNSVNVGRVLRSVTRFSDAAAEHLDQEILEEIFARARTGDYLLPDYGETSSLRAGKPSTAKPDEGDVDVYAWIASSDATRRLRRLQALRVIPFGVRDLVWSGTTDVEDGRSVIEILGRQMGSSLTGPQVARVMRAFPVDGWTEVANEAGLQAPGRRFASVYGDKPQGSAYRQRLQLLCRFVSRLGGTNVLDVHPIEDVLHVADRFRGFGQLGPDTPEWSSAMRSSIVSDTPGFVSFFHRQGMDYVQTIERNVADALGQDAVPLASGKAGRASLTLRILLDEGVAASTLATCSKEWHGRASALQEGFERLRSDGVRETDPPTERVLNLKAGTLTWLTTPLELIEEGRAMNHCVGSYDDHVLQGTSCIASVVADDGTRATLEMVPSSRAEGPYESQFLSYGNRPPSDRCRAVTAELHEGIRAGEIVWTDPPKRERSTGHSYGHEISGSMILDVLRPVLPKSVRGWSVADWAVALSRYGVVDPAHVERVGDVTVAVAGSRGR